MTDPIPVPPTVYVVADRRTAPVDHPELTVYASEQAAYAAIGQAAMQGTGLSPGDVSVQTLLVQGASAPEPAPFVTPLMVMSRPKRPDWLRGPVSTDGETLHDGTDHSLGYITTASQSTAEHADLTRYIADLINAHAALLGGRR